MNLLTTSTRALLLMGGIAIGATGCGELAEQALESAVEKGVEASAEADGEDVDFDLDLDSGTAEITVGDNTGTVGADLDRPDWLDDDFDLPDNLNIVTVVVDSEVGQSMLSGQILDTPHDEILEQQRNAVEDIGFNVVDDINVDAASGAQTGGLDSLRAEHDDGRIIEIGIYGTDEFTQYSFVLRQADAE